MFGSDLLQACSFLVRDSKRMAPEVCSIREELGEAEGQVEVVEKL